MMDKPGEMNTSVSILNKLKQNNHDNEFVLKNNKLFCAQTDKYYQPEDLKIIKTYRFEGESDPADNSVIYVIRVCNTDTIGYSFSAYGVYADDGNIDDLIRKIPIRREEAELYKEAEEIRKPAEHDKEKGK